MPSGSDKQGSSTPKKATATPPTPEQETPTAEAAAAAGAEAEGANAPGADEKDGTAPGVEEKAPEGEQPEEKAPEEKAGDAPEGEQPAIEPEPENDEVITGDRSAAMQAESVAAQKASGGRPRPTTGQTREQVVLRAGDTEVPYSVAGETDALVTLNADVWQEVWPENAQRPSHILLFHAGQVVPKSKLDQALAANAG